MAIAPCAIWGTPADLSEKSGDFEIYDSPRAGGRYWISGTAIAMLTPLTDHAKRLLTTWLCEQRHAGAELPQVPNDIVALVSTRRALPITARLTTALRTLGRHIAQLGTEVHLGDMAKPDTLRFLAKTESSNTNELMELLRMLQQTGFVEAAFYLSGSGRFRPTAAGWGELDRLNRPHTDSS